MTLEELPVGEGETSREALDDLRRKLTELSDKTSKEDQTEQDAYDAETSHGTNRVKQVAATAAIQKRLKAAGIVYANESSDEETDPAAERESPLELLGRTLKKDR